MKQANNWKTSAWQSFICNFCQGSGKLKVFDCSCCWSTRELYISLFQSETASAASLLGQRNCWHFYVFFNLVSIILLFAYSNIIYNTYSSFSSSAMASTRNSLSPYVDFRLLDFKDWVKSQHFLSWGEVIGGVRSLVCRRVSVVEAWRPGVEACLFHSLAFV